MFKKGVVMGIYSITPVHAGSGSELSYIDLPIQRERHTEFPVIWGQSLKGGLRDAYQAVERENKNELIDTNIIFGPENGGTAMGAISVGDAKILLFPVRSAKGLFVYVTSPMVLRRFEEDLRYIGKNEDFKLPQISKQEIYTSSSNNFVGNIKYKNNENKAILEDLAFEIKDEDNIVKTIVKSVNEVSPVNIEENRVALVSDDIFKYFVKNTTEVLPRVGIDDSKGTVKPGALWWEEYLPTDTLLYSVIVGKDYDNKNKDKKRSVEDILGSIKTFNEKCTYIQIGGNNTIGKGVCKINIWG